MNDNTLLACRDLNKSFGKKKILSGCSLELQAGELVGLVGENGSGKSTFINCVLGFVPPSSGEIRLSGSFGFCPQENVLHRRFKVSEHLRLAESIYRQHSQIDGDFVEMCIDRLKLRPYLPVFIRDLSSGTYQKVKFLTAVYHAPRLIFLDEPYDGFDWQMYLAFWEIMAELKSRGTAALMVSHLIYDLEKYDRIFALNGGTLEQTQ